MLTPWLAVDGVQEQVTAWSERIGLDLVRLGTTADADEIKDTAVTQPLVVALALVAFDQLSRMVDLPADTVVTGHSVGELAAAGMAGALAPDDAVALAAVRGAEMAAACALEATGMAAVMGGDPEAVQARLAELELTPANLNGAGQIVAAGSVSALEKLVAEPPAGTKIIVLKVAGAFHTHYMAPAEAALRDRARDIAVRDPALPLVSNADGAVLRDGAELLRRLVAQVTLPVRWNACMATLAELGVAATVEMPPAGTLSGLVKRELKGTVTVPLKSPEELPKVAALIAEHGGAR